MPGIDCVSLHIDYSVGEYGIGNMSIERLNVGQHLHGIRHIVELDRSSLDEPGGCCGSVFFYNRFLWVGE